VTPNPFDRLVVTLEAARAARVRLRAVSRDLQDCYADLEPDREDILYSLLDRREQEYAQALRELEVAFGGCVRG
jgi:hypothetical protein